jgi:dTDP-4-dehydrorhamnose reductase
MRVAVTGAEGRFGYALAEAFRPGHTVEAFGHRDADITRADEIQAIFARIKPEVIVHPAGIPDLDVCETDPARAFLVNYHGTRNVVAAAREVGASVAYISTDAVFDGKKGSPYVESDQTRPLTVYGRTKLRAEEVVRNLPQYWIFRVSVLFGAGKENFISNGLRKIKDGRTWVVAADQLGSATFTRDAAGRIRDVIEARRFGLFHLCNSGACTRLELARRAVELAGLDAKLLVGKPDAEMGRRAKRLQYAVMEMRALAKAGFSPIRSWQDALAEYVPTVEVS